MKRIPNPIPQKFRRYTSWVVLVLALASLWWFILPPSLGGRTTFFVTKGVSMEPYLHTNDLAILHKSGKYKVGDVVAYHAKSLNSVLLHRVIAVDPDNGQLTLQGDNNKQADNDHPTQKETIGRLDHKIDGAGTKYMWIKSWPVRVIGALLVAWSVYGAMRNFQQRKDVGEEESELLTESGNGDPPGKSRARASSSGRLGSISFRPSKYNYLIGVAIVLSALIFAASFALQVGAKPQTVRYSLETQFDYSAVPTKAGGDMVYQQGKAVTGDSLYLSLVDNIDFNFHTDLTTQGKFEGKSTYSVDAVLSSQNGWNHTIHLVDPTVFDGISSDQTASISVLKMKDISNQIQTLTTIKESRYNVSLKANLKVDGSLDGTQFSQNLTNELKFTADQQKWLPAAVAAANDGPPTAEALKSGEANKAGRVVKSGSVIASPDFGERIVGKGDSAIGSLLKTIGFAGFLAALAALILANIQINRRTRDEVQTHDLSAIAAKKLKEFMEQAAETTAANTNPVADPTYTRSTTAVAGETALIDAPAEPLARVDADDVEAGFDDLDRKLDELDKLLPQLDDDDEIDDSPDRAFPTAEERFGVGKSTLEGVDAPAVADEAQQ